MELEMEKICISQALYLFNYGIIKKNPEAQRERI